MIWMATATKRKVVMLGPCFPTTMRQVRIGSLMLKDKKRGRRNGELTICHLSRQVEADLLMTLLDGQVELVNHILEVLTFQIAERLHSRALDLLDVPLDVGDLIVHGRHSTHHLVKTFVLVCHVLVKHVEQIVNAVGDDLDAVMEINKLILL